MPPIPLCMRCAISRKIMINPAMAADGGIYERENILSWFRAGNVTSPVTRDILPTREVRPVAHLKEMIDEYLYLRHKVQQQQSDWQEYLEKQQDKATRKLAQKK